MSSIVVVIVVGVVWVVDGVGIVVVTSRVVGTSRVVASRVVCLPAMGVELGSVDGNV